MASNDELIALNLEIARRETVGDAEWFDRLLAPEFVMRRSSGVHVDRAVFLAGVKKSGRRETPEVQPLHESDRSAMVTCVVSVEQKDGSWKAFQNCRLFTRPEPAAAWQLLGWANEPARYGVVS